MAQNGGVLNGRRALVTGASRGIGADIARRLAQHGAAVAVAARSDEAAPDPRLPGTIRSVAEEIRKAGGSAVPVRMDVRNPDSIRAGVEQAARELGGLDLVVNNAGVLVPGTLESVQERHINLIWEIDLRGPILVSKIALPHLKRAGRGDIINISSVAAEFPGPGPYAEPSVGGAFYGTMKAGLERFTQGIAQELQPDRIACNVLSLRYLIRTPGHYLAQTTADKPKTEFDSAEWMGRACVWIASQGSDFTGHIVYDDDIRDRLKGL